MGGIKVGWGWRAKWKRVKREDGEVPEEERRSFSRLGRDFLVFYL